MNTTPTQKTASRAAQARIVAPEKLAQCLEGGARVFHVNKNGTQVAAQWPDGSTGLLSFKYSDWHFVGDNAAYEAGYAYACGYRD